jgi:hypothetical protein
MTTTDKRESPDSGSHAASSTTPTSCDSLRLVAHDGNPASADSHESRADGEIEGLAVALGVLRPALYASRPVPYILPRPMAVGPRKGRTVR